MDDDRDGQWETIGEKKVDEKRKEQLQKEKEKTEQFYNDYLNKF